MTAPRLFLAQSLCQNGKTWIRASQGHSIAQAAAVRELYGVGFGVMVEPTCW